MLLCAKCHGESRVVDSRVSNANTRRRRECLTCKHRWSTLELSFELAETLQDRLTNLRATLSDVKRMIHVMEKTLDHKT